jgi:hypothetical protein
MILLSFIAAGLLMRLALGNPMQGLATVRLKGESILLIMLVGQLALPALHLRGAPARVAFLVWAATFPVMILVCWVNRHEPGIPLVGSGLFLNMVVVYANGGMPVHPAAVAMAQHGAVVSIPAGDFVHVAATGGILLPWLADILPATGPSWIRLVASPGDCLLAAGIAAYIACSAQGKALRG